MVKVNNVLETIGNTPTVKINKLFGENANVYVKIEKRNPGGSIKDRIALAMIEDAEKKGLLIPGKSEIVEPTSGNTGIGLALVAAVKGYPLTLVMPESMSVERRQLMIAYGAKLELTDKAKGMKGAIAHAYELRDQNPNVWIPQQFENPANIEVHERTTAQEILRDFPEGVDYVITGVGTGGHISGVAKVLKEKFPNVKVFAVEPELSPVISGGKPGPHPIQGIGAGFIPQNLKTELLDGVIQVKKEDAFNFAIRAAREEGLHFGLSSGASLAAVSYKLPDLPPAAVVLTFAYDTGERYLSIDGLYTPKAGDIHLYSDPPVPPTPVSPHPYSILSNLETTLYKAGPKNSILETIGDTPHIKINKLFPADYNVYMKAEKYNPGGSIKDRIGLWLIEDAERKGLLVPGKSHIVEPTSGNTGIGLALVAAVKGYPLTLVMPESMSVERRQLMIAYGAKLELTDKAKGMKGAIAKALELKAENANVWIPQQFENPANIEVHEKFTAQEILRDFPEGVDYIITGVGTGGHITGVAEVLKKSFPKLEVYAVEPEASPVLSGGKPGPHPIMGIGAGFIPANAHTELLDGIITVSNTAAFEYTVKSARLEGLHIGISSGASLAAVAKKLPAIPKGSTILVFSYDTGERYLSVNGLFKIEEGDIRYATATTPASAPAPVPAPVSAPAPVPVEASVPLAPTNGINGIKPLTNSIKEVTITENVKVGAKGTDGDKQPATSIVEVSKPIHPEAIAAAEAEKKANSCFCLIM